MLNHLTTTTSAVLLLFLTLSSLPQAVLANPVTPVAGEVEVALLANSTVSLPEPAEAELGDVQLDGHAHARAHAARGVTGNLHCGNWPNANGAMAKSLVAALGQGGLKTRGYSVAAHGCNRVNCWDTSGVYVCNDNSHAITVTGQQVHDAAKTITNQCCHYSQTDQETGGKILAGQQFTQNGWNVIIGYANCNHATTQKPSDLGGWGVNGGTCKSWSTHVTNA